MGATLGLAAVFPDFTALRTQNFPGIVFPKPTIMLAMSPRTGSTHLCAALHQAGHSAEPNEIFNPRGPALVLRDRYRVTGFADYIASLARAPDADFIFKTSWQDVAPFAPALPGMFPNLRVVYIERRNIAAQAVSLFRAQRRNFWHRRPGQAAPAPAVEEHFDLPRLCAIVAELQAEKCSWEAWFTAQGITPLRLRYEDFETDVNTALRVLAAAFSLPLRTNLPPTAGLEKLADSTSRDWVLRLQKHLFNMS
ncbi:MAG: Stf0 family sulfotransferase [Acidocella sp.]|nr:Stf0 family sulfotransferase [Acidocella sp.]